VSYTHKPDSGSLFVNDRKEQPTHSDWKGSALIGGVEYWVNEWNVTTDRDGNKLPKDKYRKNLKFKPKQEKAAKPSAPPPADDFDDDIPF
jgi:hypothetical protein